MSNTSSTTQPHRPYSPSDNDHLIFRWVKLEGQSQAWVASQFGISQSTVSRIIQRYERWQAHASEREGGRLDHAERLRYQRWLTFQRNELILASCLRIAQNLEGFVDSTKSTTSHPHRYPQDQTKVRTEHFAIDRTGSVARFLRLAFRINMDQLKLAQLDPAPLPEPLSAEELAAQERDALAIAEDFATAKRRTTAQLNDITSRSHASRENTPPDASRPDFTADSVTDLVTRVPPGDALLRGSSLGDLPIDNSATAASPSATAAASTENFKLETSNSDLHNLHNENAAESGATADQPCTCAPTTAPKKNAKPSRITRSAAREGEAPAEPLDRFAHSEGDQWQANRKLKRTRRRHPIAAK